MRWLTDVRRILSIVFKGEDPVVRELREARHRQEQLALKVFRTIHEELLKKEQDMIKARDEAVTKIKSLKEEALAIMRPELARDRELSMDELYAYLQALKQNKIPFDLNADIRTQLKALQESSGVDPSAADTRVDRSQQDQALADQFDIRAHIEQLGRADHKPSETSQEDKEKDKS